MTIIDEQAFDTMAKRAGIKPQLKTTARRFIVEYEAAKTAGQPFSSVDATKPVTIWGDASARKDEAYAKAEESSSPTSCGSGSVQSEAERHCGQSSDSQIGSPAEQGDAPIVQSAPANPSLTDGYYLPKGHPDHPFTGGVAGQPDEQTILELMARAEAKRHLGNEDNWRGDLEEIRPLFLAIRPYLRQANPEAAQPDETEIRVDTNNINSFVKITHMPTGVSAQGNIYPSQTMNKCYAMGVLAERLLVREPINLTPDERRAADTFVYNRITPLIAEHDNTFVGCREIAEASVTAFLEWWGKR